MNEIPMLTFAELEFMLRVAQPARAAVIRQHLKLPSPESSEVVAAAGLASLLTRGLCMLEGTESVPTPAVVGVTAALSTSHTYTEGLGWIGDQMVLMHVFSGASVRLALFPAIYGQFSAEFLDPTEPLAGPLTRFLDRCLTGESASAVLIKSTTGEDEVTIAVATDDSGVWYVSDSASNPERGAPASRDVAAQRLVEILSARPVVA